MAGTAEGLDQLLRAIARGDNAAVEHLIEVSPALASAQVGHGATRQDARAHYLPEIGHYVYGGDSALHVAAAAYRGDIVQRLIAASAVVSVRNRRGATPLHYAADGQPNSPRWNPEAQAATIAALIAAGADPNSVDKSGVAPIHRAVRTRCAAAVAALLAGGADPSLPNGSGSTPMQLATQNTGRGGSGSDASKAQQQEIIGLLESRR